MVPPASIQNRSGSGGLLVSLDGHVIVAPGRGKMLGVANICASRPLGRTSSVTEFIHDDMSEKRWSQKSTLVVGGMASQPRIHMRVRYACRQNLRRQTGGNQWLDRCDRTSCWENHMSAADASEFMYTLPGSVIRKIGNRESALA